MPQIYRRIRYGKPIVVVSGLPRSGTSMVMKMLEAGGMPLVTDSIRKADEHNPKGYYEYEKVKKLAKERDKSWLAGVRGKAIKIISYLLKELPPTYNYRVLFLRRNLREVLASQRKMLAQQGEVPETPDARMMEIFEKELAANTCLLKQPPHFEVLDMQYHEILAHPVDQARRIVEFLGRPLGVVKMARVVDPQLYRNRYEDDVQAPG